MPATPPADPLPVPPPQPPPGDEPGWDRAPGPGGAALAAAILGSPATLRWEQVSSRSGVALDRAQVLWRALGLSEVDPSSPVFSDGDVEALQLLDRLMDSGVVDEESAVVFARRGGRALHQLAEQAVEIAGALGDPQTAAAVGPTLLPTLERLLILMWRRHLLDAAERALSAPGDQARPVVVGFVDLVDYTSAARTLAPAELDGWVERFEAVCHARVAAAGGRVVKTLGDEVMWTCPDPVSGAVLALALADPTVRVGAAYGPTITRSGDHVGASVNVAARLTGLARPGTVLVDRALGDALRAARDQREGSAPGTAASPPAAHDGPPQPPGSPSWAAAGPAGVAAPGVAAQLLVKPLRPVAVPGYRHLHAHVLRGVDDVDGSVRAAAPDSWGPAPGR